MICLMNPLRQRRKKRHHHSLMTWFELPTIGIFILNKLSLHYEPIVNHRIMFKTKYHLYDNKGMTYENYKKGMFRVFIVLSIPLELVTYFQYDLSFTNKFFYSLEILSQTLVIFWCIYLIGLLVAKPFIGFLGKS